MFKDCSEQTNDYNVDIYSSLNSSAPHRPNGIVNTNDKATN